MKTTVKVGGNFVFDPRDSTSKHIRQSAWKKTAIVNIHGDISDMYAWFLRKKGLILNPPLRGAHVTFINDRFAFIKAKNDIARQELWDKVSEEYKGKYVEFELELTPYSTGKHWWLRVQPKSRGGIQKVRDILGLGEYKWGFHMTIGLANEKNIIRSQYLRHLEEFGFEDKRTREFAFDVLTKHRNHDNI